MQTEKLLEWARTKVLSFSLFFAFQISQILQSRLNCQNETMSVNWRIKFVFCDPDFSLFFFQSLLRKSFHYFSFLDKSNSFINFARHGKKMFQRGSSVRPIILSIQESCSFHFRFQLKSFFQHTFTCDDFSYFDVTRSYFFLSQLRRWMTIREASIFQFELWATQNEVTFLLRETSQFSSSAYNQICPCSI